MNHDPVHATLAPRAGSECVAEAAGPALRKELNLFDGIAIVVGTVIGSGIFLLPSYIAVQLHSLFAVLLVWVTGGILTVCGALSLAELGASYPGAGGICVYLREAFGRLPAFLYAWGLLLIIHSGSIAGLAVSFGLYAGQVLPMGVAGEKALSAACILALTAISCVGIRGGKMVQNLIATAKIGGLAGMIVLLTLRGSRPLQLFPVSGGAGAAYSTATFGVALIAVLWAYEGWHILSFVAGEMKRPQRDLPRSLYYGTGLVTLIYIVANLAYYHVLSPAEIQHSNAVAALAVGRVLGPVASKILSILILVSIFGATNGLILSGPRVYFAMARDGAVPAIFGKVDERYRTPMAALIVQGVWAAVLAVSGSYQQIFTDVIFTAWIFYGLAVAGVIVIRRKHPLTPRPFSVPGYPFVPLLFCAAAAGLVVSTIAQSPTGAFTGLGMIGAGIPVYWIYNRRRRANP